MSSNHARKRMNKLQMTSLLVATSVKSDGGKIFGTGNSLNLTNGQVGVMGYDQGDHNPKKLGDFLIPGDTIDTSNDSIRIVQGTPNSSNIAKVNPFNVGHLATIESDTINRDQIQSVTFSLPNPDCASGESYLAVPGFQPTSDTQYSGYIISNGPNQTLTNGVHNVNNLVNFETPDYVALGTVDPLDHMLQNFAYNANVYSSAANNNCKKFNGSQPFVTFAVGTADKKFGDLVAGDIIPFLRCTGADACTPLDETISITIDESMICAIGCLLSKNPDLAAYGITVIDPTTAGQAVNTVGLVTLSLRQDMLEFVDGCNNCQNPEYLQSNARLSLGEGFLVNGAFNKTCSCYSSESTNDGCKWKYEENSRVLGRFHTLQRRSDGMNFGERASYIDVTKSYAAFTIDYVDNEETLTINEPSPKQTHVLMEACIDLSQSASKVADRITQGILPFPVNVCDSAIATDLNAILTPWLESAREDSHFTYLNLSTPAAVIVPGV